MSRKETAKAKHESSVIEAKQSALGIFPFLRLQYPHFLDRTRASPHRLAFKELNLRLQHLVFPLELIVSLPDFWVWVFIHLHRLFETHLRLGRLDDDIDLGVEMCLLVVLLV